MPTHGICFLFTLFGAVLYFVLLLVIYPQTRPARDGPTAYRNCYYISYASFLYGGLEVNCLHFPEC